MFGISDINSSLNSAETTPRKSSDVGQASEFKELMMNNLRKSPDISNDLAIQRTQNKDNQYRGDSKYERNDQNVERNERKPDRNNGKDMPAEHTHSGKNSPTNDRTTNADKADKRSSHQVSNRDNDHTLDEGESDMVDGQVTTTAVDAENVPDKATLQALSLANIEQWMSDNSEEGLAPVGKAMDTDALTATLPTQEMNPEMVVAPGSLEARINEHLKQSGISIHSDQPFDALGSKSMRGNDLGAVVTEQLNELTGTKVGGKSSETLNLASITNGLSLDLKSNNNNLMKLGANMTPSTEASAPAGGVNTAQLAARMERAGVPATAVPIESAKASVDFSNKIQWMVGRGLSSAEIRLDPPELGALRVHVTNREDSTNVTFVAQTSAAKEALEQQLPRLREQLESQGLNLGDVNVFDQSAQDQYKDDENENGTMNNAKDDEATELVDIAPPKILISEGLVNEIA